MWPQTTSSLLHSIAEENCCDSLGQWMDSQSGWEPPETLGCLTEAEQPDRPEAKGDQFNLADLRGELKKTNSINLQEMGKMAV